MKLIGLSVLAALMAVPTIPAAAQMRHVEVSRTTTTVTEHRGNYRHNRHKVCRTEWRHHHKVRRCFWR